jgi:hypothetical protein
MVMAWAALRLLLSTVLLLPGAATALGGLELNERLLERVDARAAGGEFEIAVGTTRRLRYLSHTLGEAGRVLQIQLVPEDSSVTGHGVGLLPWTGSSQVPLQEVSSQASVTTATLILHFSVPVAVNAVRVNTDDRSVIVKLSASGGSAANAVRRSGIFVLELASWGAEGKIDPALTMAAGPGTVLYQVRTRMHDSLRYRLRAGFFDSEEAADAAKQAFVKTYPDAWVSEITAPERGQVLAGARLVDLSQLMVEPESDRTLPAVSLDRLTEMMEEARSTAAAAEWSRAGLLYERVAAYAVAPFQQDARELVGVVREKGGQLAQAATLYNSYLKQYPEGDAAERVRQRLAALSAPASGAVPAGAAAPGRGKGWETYGSWSQFYAQDLLTAGDLNNDSVRSLLTSDVDLNTRRRGENNEMRFRLSGGYDHDFLQSTDSEWHLSTAYFDFATRDQRHIGRVGRQTRSSGGVLGRFDGLYYGYRLSPRYRLNVVSGLPVDFSSGSPDTSRVFYGVNLDLGPVAKYWNFNVFAVNQTADGTVDRQAVGGELRYARGSSTGYGLFDYDVAFNAPNVLYFIGSTSFGEDTTVSLVADQRKNPLLSARNALMGQQANTLDDLGRNYTEEELRQLALDRTATSTTYSGALTQVLGERWRLSGDVTMTRLGKTSASGGVEAFPESGPDWYYNLQLLGSDLFRPEDFGTMGLRYTDATNYESIGVIGQYRLRFANGLLLNPRLRVDRRQTVTGASQWLYVPTLRATHALTRKWSLELEASAELLDEKLGDTSDSSKLYLIYLGYRYEF